MCPMGISACHNSVTGHKATAAALIGFDVLERESCNDDLLIPISAEGIYTLIPPDDGLVLHARPCLFPFVSPYPHNNLFNMIICRSHVYFYTILVLSLALLHYSLCNAIVFPNFFP